jgi:replicative DNA helicase
MEQNKENETGLLGAVLRDPSIFEGLSEIIMPEDFGWYSYGRAWKAMLSLHEHGMTIDTITLGDELGRWNELDDFGMQGADGVIMWKGRAALSKLREIGDPRAAESYAQKISDYAAKRQLLEIMTEGANWSMNGRTAADIMTDIASRMGNIRVYDTKASHHTQTLAEAVSQAYDHTAAAAGGEITYVQTGFIDLDRILGGLSAPDVYVIAGRPGQGKSAFLTSVTRNVALQGKRTAFFSLEASNKQNAMRMISMESGISFDRQKTGRLLESDWPLYTQAVETLADLKAYPVVFNDMPSISISRVRQELRRIKQLLGGLDIVMFDYIQLGGADKKHERRDLEVGEITRGLKSLAKEFDVPILAAAQLNRALEQRSEKRPVLSDLRESGSIENDAQCVMFIYRPDQYEKDSAKTNVAEIIIAKHNNGAVGSVELIYRSSLTRFESAVTRNFEPRKEWTDG